jgi:hypothetical protein
VKADEKQWIERLQTVGRSQARYLWILLVTNIFFLALDRQGTAGAGSLRLPIVGLRISAEVVVAAGPVVLSFLLLSYLGALRAYSQAWKALGLDLPVDSDVAEAFDTSPNALDLAYYTTPRTPVFIREPLHFVVPFVLTGFLSAVVWLAYRVTALVSPGPWRAGSLALTLLLGGAAFFQIFFGVWPGRAKEAWRRRVGRDGYPRD